MKLIRAIVTAQLLAPIFGLTPAFSGETETAKPQIPALNWEQRSDWFNVKQHGAAGDGVSDDTEAVQKAFDMLTDSGDSLKDAQSRVVYFPPGRYRITRTLAINHATGAYVVGHGRDSVLCWDGEKDGTLYWSNGAQYTRYEGLTFDGRGIAANGVRHHSESYYETHIRYQHCAFVNFTMHGLVVGAGLNGKPPANESAEVWYDNCLFARCGKGVALYQYNDFDHWFTRCAFVDCGVGLDSERGNFMFYFCSFARSTTVDIRQGSPSHSSSIRLCTSTGSRRFFETGSWVHQSFAIQDCRIDNWTGNDGAIVLGRRGPTTIFDCVFVNPPGEAAPIRLVNPRDIQQVLLVSNNESRGTKVLVDRGPNSRVTEIPAGKRGPVLINSQQQFLQDAAHIPGKVFDAKRDFGAKGDGRSDDTDALERCIAAAKVHGRNAIAYLPGGIYRICRTLAVDGGDYTLGGVGFTSHLQWAGEADGVMVSVRDPRDVTVEHLALYQAPKTAASIRQTSAGGRSSVFYDGLYTGICGPNGVGMELVELPEQAVVRMGLISGPLRLRDCSRAAILGDIHVYELTLSGAKHPKSGFTGFLYHNDAVHDYALEVIDNQDVVIANFYSESNRRYLLAEGGTRLGAGRITIGAQKISTLDGEAVTVKDYEGHIFIGGGDAWNQTDASRPLIFAHTGTRPVSLLLAGNGYWHQEPQWSFGPGLRLISLGNILIENKYPEYNERNVSDQPAPLTGAVLAEVAAAFDHFRELNAAYVKLASHRPDAECVSAPSRDGRQDP
jgi:hypothetical protein